MSFFQTSDNKAIDTTGSFNSNVGFPIIPDGTKLVACITEAKWDDYQDEQFIKLTWSILDGEFKNIKVFQKVKVREQDKNKKDKALRMLAAIDANAGGNLVKLGVEPQDMELMANLTNKPMGILVAVWDMNGKQGNWIQAVASLGDKAPVMEPIPVAEATANVFDDIPF